MNWICKIFGHDTKPSDLPTWRETGINFGCLRCGMTWQKFEDMK